jgi:hypothetical protein
VVSREIVERLQREVEVCDARQEGPKNHAPSTNHRTNFNASGSSGAGMTGAQVIHANVYATPPLAKCGSEEQLNDTIHMILR